MTALAPGDKVGRYVVEAMIGEGGMGRVYRARDPQLERPVALKVLAVESATGDGTARLLREARAAAALHHENAVAVFDVGESDGVAYIAMELVSGSSLRAFVGDASVSLRTKLRWLRDVARVLDAAHARGFVHRDIKPENVMIRDDGAVKVLDFGIARLQPLAVAGNTPTVPAGAATLTKEGAIVGTPSYMAPEQLRGLAIDGRADMFAWGIVAYELLAGRRPFASGSNDLVTVIAQILDQAPDPLPNGVAPPAVAAMVMRALEKDRDARFRSMAECVAILDAGDIAVASAPSLPPDVAEPTGEMTPAVRTRPSPPAIARRSSRGLPRPSRASLIALAAVVGASFGIFVASGSMRRPAPTPVADAGAHALALLDAATPVTARPLPKTSNLEALAAYRAGVQAARDGAGSGARAAFDHAVELDPNIAEAHLWLALLLTWQNRARARLELDRATQLRVSLSDPDLALLAGFEPLLRRDPPDLTAAVARFEEATARFPGDALLRLELASVRVASGDARAVAEADAALAIDPSYVAARLVKAQALETTGTEDAALEAYGQCVAASALSSSCLLGHVKILARRGRCDAVAEDVQRWTSTAPTDPEAFRHRAMVAVTTGGGTAAAAELLRQSRDLLPQAQRPRRELLDAMVIALEEGRLAAAKEAAAKLADPTHADRSVSENGEAATALVEIDEELGDARGAGAVASQFLSLRSTWVEVARVEQDPTPLMLSVARRGGRIDAEAERAGRDAWLAKWASRGRPTERWLAAWAVPAFTADEARAALAALPVPAAPIAPAGARTSLALGRVYLRAGRTDDAVPVLERVANDCLHLRDPIAHVRGLALLGEAHEARSERDAACAAYRAVADAWRGVHAATHDRAVARLAALHCP